MSNLRLFIQEHRKEDVRQLALKASQFPDIDMPFALDQIAGWQMACKKLPSWAAVKGIVYPPHLSMEQCSSEQTALYKKMLVKRLLSELFPSGATSHALRLVDLTGGFGVDFSFLATLFSEAIYVECQEHLCRIAQENFSLLGLRQSKVVHDDSINYLRQMESADVIYLDPARRDSQGSRTFAIHDCTPDVLSIKEELLRKAPCVIVKLSPMLDWHQAVEELSSVSEVHIVAVGNECKELLLVLKGDVGLQHDKQKSRHLTVHCANDSQRFMFRRDNEGCRSDSMEEGMPPSAFMTYKDIDEQSLADSYLYEPNASVMKAGCFDVIMKCYGVTAIGKNSHLFVSKELISDFPGRKFLIKAFSTMNKRELKVMLKDISKANVAVRNFPLSSNDLRKRLRLSDGGDDYLFGTTTDDGKHLVVLTMKING